MHQYHVARSCSIACGIKLLVVTNINIYMYIIILQKLCGKQKLFANSCIFTLIYKVILDLELFFCLPDKYKSSIPSLFWSPPTTMAVL